MKLLSDRELTIIWLLLTRPRHSVAEPLGDGFARPSQVIIDAAVNKTKVSRTDAECSFQAGPNLADFILI